MSGCCASVGRIDNESFLAGLVVSGGVFRATLATDVCTGGLTGRF